MSFMNRLGNAKNPYQTGARRVLCLCSAGLLRSPTTANVLHKEYGYNTRAAGVSDEYALIPVDDVLLSWADEIVCVNPEIYDELKDKKTTIGLSAKDIIVLNIPDSFAWNDSQLQEIIKEQYSNAEVLSN